MRSKLKESFLPLYLGKGRAGLKVVDSEKTARLCPGTVSSGGGDEAPEMGIPGQEPFCYC